MSWSTKIRISQVEPLLNGKMFRSNLHFPSLLHTVQYMYGITYTPIVYNSSLLVADCSPPPPAVVSQGYVLAGGTLPCIVLRCMTRSPTSERGSWVSGWASCPRARLSDMMKSPARHCKNKCATLHFKTGLKIFVVVILKQWLVGGTPPMLLSVWHQLYNLICGGWRLQIYSWCHYDSYH